MGNKTQIRKINKSGNQQNVNIVSWCHCLSFYEVSVPFEYFFFHLYEAKFYFTGHSHVRNFHWGISRGVSGGDHLKWLKNGWLR